MSNNSDCHLICLNSIPFTIDNVLFSNAEIESSVAEYDPAVTAGSGYPINAQVITESGSIYSSTENQNTTVPGNDFGGGKFVYDPLARQYSYRQNWNTYTTFALDQETYGRYDTLLRTYHVWKSLVNNNQNNALPAIGNNNTNWEYVGTGNNLKHTRTDLTGAISVGETIWSIEQNKGFVAIVDIVANSGERLPLHTADGTEAIISKWKQVGKINPLKIYEPSHTQRTVRDGNFTIEFLLDRRFKNFSMWAVSGEQIELTIWDSNDQIIFNLIRELIKPVDNFESWLFDPIEYDDNLVLLDLPWDTQVRVRVEITGSGECGAGGIYPSDSLFCGHMNYKPLVKILDSTEETSDPYDPSVSDVSIGDIVYQVDYKTTVEPIELDRVVDNIIKIKKDAKKYGLPSVFIGTNRYKAFQMLGRMPVSSVSLDNEAQTNVKMNITGVI